MSANLEREDSECEEVRLMMTEQGSDKALRLLTYCS